MTLVELESALAQARAQAPTGEPSARAQVLRSLLDAIAERRGYTLRLRK
jgi:hypothetical protein